MEAVTAPHPAVTGALWAAGPAPHRPTGAAFDVVLLLHVACAVVGLGTVVASAVQAGRLRSAGSGPVPDGLRAYFIPGVNWAGRALYGVPVFGFVLLGMSGGFFHLGDGWVLWGLTLWVLAIFGAEWALWPAERRIQVALASTSVSGPGDPATDDVAPAVPVTAVAPAIAGRVAAECRTIVWVGIGLALILLLAGFLMVAQP